MRKTFGEQKLGPQDYEDITVDTEDQGCILLEFDNGAKGALLVSQVIPGRKNRIHFEISGSKESIAWNGENPNEM